MSAVVPPSGPRIGDEQRLGATLVLSLLLHGMLVLGIGFTLDDAAPVLPTLDVILTETTSPLTQKQADFLAQASNQGGGEHERSNRPRDAQAGMAPQPEPGGSATTRSSSPPNSPGVSGVTWRSTRTPRRTRSATGGGPSAPWSRSSGTCWRPEVDTGVVSEECAV